MFDNGLPDYSHINFVCEQPHDNWYEYLWSTEHIYSLHNSKHMFDPYTFVHMMNTGVMYLMLSQIIGNNETTIVIAFLISFMYELVENTINHIFQYGIASGSFGSGGTYIPKDSDKRVPHVHIENGKEYRFVRIGFRVYMVDKDDKKVRRIQMWDLPKYGLKKHYRGDSILNIIGDNIANLSGILIVAYLLTTEDNVINLVIYFTILFLICIALIPDLIGETARYIYLSFNDKI